MISDLLGIGIFFLSFVSIFFLAECFHEWAVAYKKRGYIGKRQLKRMRKWLDNGIPARGTGNSCKI